MTSRVNKNDSGWEELFFQYSILEKINAVGYFQITALQINAIREARLMTKFDHVIKLPKIFSSNGLTIHPISRGEYIIGRFETYQKLHRDPSCKVEYFSLPTHLETVEPFEIYSESSALICANHAGMISALLGGQKTELTTFGRMSTGIFQYRIQEKSGTFRSISVENSQCEIDAGFESESSFAIVEAKFEEVEDFNIRQLYYPYRLWEKRIQKKVIPIFLYFSADTFNFFVYEFIDKEVYNSLRLLEHRCFKISSPPLGLAEIERALLKQRIFAEPSNTAFPQADSFNRVIDLLTKVQVDGVLSKESITSDYAFNDRQTQYYTAAASYLGLLERSRNIAGQVLYNLSAEGLRIMGLSPNERNLEITKKIFPHKAFNKTFKLYHANGRRPEISQVVTIMKERGATSEVLSENTYERRAQTILNWIEWILDLVEA